MQGDIPDWVIRTSHAARTVVESWYDGQLVADDIPLDAGTLEVTADANVPGRLDLTFPSEWAPKQHTDPLGIYGQRLIVRQVLTVGQDEWTVDLGQYRVQGWDHQAPAVSVEALSLEQVILDYRFNAPYKRPSGATFASTLKAMCKGLIPVDTSAVTDRSLPAGLADDWEEDRMAAVRSLATNWPADLRVDPDGVLVASPERTVQGTPHVTWTHGEADAYITVGGNALRDEVYNAVVARGEKADGTPVQATAVDDNPASPTYFYGPYGRRQRFYESPLITTVAQARTAAETVLRREQRRTAIVTVTTPPDPRVELLDTARVTLETGATFTGLVTGISLPLTAVEGPATYDVAVEVAA